MLGDSPASVLASRRSGAMAVVLVAIMLFGSLGVLATVRAAGPSPSSSSVLPSPGAATPRLLFATAPGPAPVNAPSAGACPVMGGPLSCRPGGAGPASGGPMGSNSSPVPEAGSVLATVTAGGQPYGVGIDTSNGYAYVANEHTNNVTVINGTKVIAAIAVGRGPQGAIYDPNNGYMYITNTGSDNLTVINVTKIVGWVDDASFNEPDQGVFNPSNGYVYITNVGASTVTIVNGLKVVNSVTVGRYALGAAYDPADQDVYVTATGTVAQGGSSVSVISGQAVVDTIKSGTGNNFTNPSSIVYDAATGNLVVANRNAANPTKSFETLINSTNSVIATFHAGHDVYGEAYDPSNGFVYAASSDTDGFGSFGVVDNLTVLNGTSLVTNISAGIDSLFLAYRPGELLPLHPELRQHLLQHRGIGDRRLRPPRRGGISAQPLGNPVGSLDVGQSVGFATSLYATGVAPDTPKIVVQPDQGFHCEPLTLTPTGLNAENLSTTCTPTLPGNYTVWINVTDGLSKTVWSSIPWVVYPDPVAAMPVATFASGKVVTTVDAGQPVNITASIATGSGLFAPASWTGFPSGTCQATGLVEYNTNFSCRFGVPEVLNISLTINDTNGVEATSPTLELTIDPHLVANVPAATPGSADVNQTIVFTAQVDGGTGTYTSYVWTGLAGGTCSGLATPTVSCTFASTGEESVAVTVTDTNGIVSASPPLDFSVSPTLHAGTPVANRTSVDVGQSVQFTADANGGSGRYAYAWTGLPAACTGTTTPTPVCTMSEAGTVSARVTATDSNSAHIGPTTPVNVTVYTDPTVGAIIVAPRTVSEGSSVVLAVAVAGGSGQPVLLDRPAERLRERRHAGAHMSADPDRDVQRGGERRRLERVRGPRQRIEPDRQLGELGLLELARRQHRDAPLRRDRCGGGRRGGRRARPPDAQAQVGVRSAIGPARGAGRPLLPKAGRTPVHLSLTV